jgi:hypothetical protein
MAAALGFEVDREATALAERQNGVFARWQFSGRVPGPTIDRRVASGRWRRRARGVYSICGAPESWELGLRVALLEGGEGAAVSHRAAAALFGLPGFSRTNFDIVRPEARSHRRRQHSRPRNSSLIPMGHLTEIQGFPTTTLARTLFDLAGLTSPQRLRRGWHYVPEGRVIRAVDDARSQFGLSLEALAEVVDELGRRGRPGTQLMRRILDERSDGQFATESELEDLFLGVLKRYGIALPARQRTLGDDRAPLGRVDFVYPAIKLIVELDSRKHHSALTDWERDKWRDLQLAASGWRTVRISWRQLTDHPAEVADLLRRVLERVS